MAGSMSRSVSLTMNVTLISTVWMVSLHDRAKMEGSGKSLSAEGGVVFVF